MPSHHPNSNQAHVSYLQVLIRELLDSYVRYADNSPETNRFISDCRRASCPITYMPTCEGEEGDTLPFPPPPAPSTCSCTAPTVDLSPAPSHPNDNPRTPAYP